MRKKKTDPLMKILSFDTMHRKKSSISIQRKKRSKETQMRIKMKEEEINGCIREKD